MEQVTLNLARKWRSKNFDTLVGQDLAVKILKNSLYAGHYVPVYLFAGQRGCGKTSMARIFAAALNCLALERFREKPKEIALPCGICDSCVAMQRLHHPDFIEMDAASHTGVDNMRVVIEAAYYLPVLGRKKIYLIDEAHMLSKAAFNALLKLFEEPPMHAHFILATTDPEKIIETVRSRCFTLFFDALDTDVLARHLAHICAEEKIAYTHEALVYIARCAEGSARDALNILETIRFSHPTITKEGVLQALGHIDDQRLASCIRTIAMGDSASLLSQWESEGIRRVSPQQIWAGLIRLIRGMVWVHYKVMPRDVDPHIRDMLAQIPLTTYIAMLRELYTMEPLFVRAADQQGLLEFSLLQLSLRFKKHTDESTGGQSGASATQEAQSVHDDGAPEDDEEHEEEDDDGEEEGKAEPEQLFVHCKQALCTVGDSLLASLFAHLVSIEQVSEQKEITLHFGEGHKLFADAFVRAQALWHPIVKTWYQDTQTVRVLFDAPTVTSPLESRAKVLQRHHDVRSAETTVVTAAPPKEPIARKVTPLQASPKQVVYQRRPTAPIERKIDVSDAQRWPLVNKVLRYFPGTVTIVDETRI